MTRRGWTPARAWTGSTPWVSRREGLPCRQAGSRMRAKKGWRACSWHAPSCICCMPFDCTPNAPMQGPAAARCAASWMQLPWERAPLMPRTRSCRMWMPVRRPAARPTQSTRSTSPQRVGARQAWLAVSHARGCRVLLPRYSSAFIRKRLRPSCGGASASGPAGIGGGEVAEPFAAEPFGRPATPPRCPVQCVTCSSTWRRCSPRSCRQAASS